MELQLRDGDKQFSLSHEGLFAAFAGSSEA